jgi:hypothetical protein
MMTFRSTRIMRFRFLPTICINGHLNLTGLKQNKSLNTRLPVTLEPEGSPVYVGVDLSTKLDQLLVGKERKLVGKERKLVVKQHRVYCAAVILPKDSPSFQYDLFQTSDHIQCLSSRAELSDYIKNEAVAWAVFFATESGRDKKRSTTCQNMHDCINQVIQDYHQHQQNSEDGGRLEIESVGIATTPKKQTPAYFVCVNDLYNFQLRYPHVVVTKEKYERSCVTTPVGASIKAAKILAQNARDAYSLATDQYPETSWLPVQKEDPYGLFVGMAPETPWPKTP